MTVSVCMCLSSLVHSGPDRGSPHSGTELFFATRTGTRLGIETHLFRAETTKDLSLWTRHIVNGCHASAEMIKEVTTSECWHVTHEHLVTHTHKHVAVDGEEWAGHCSRLCDASSDVFRHAAAKHIRRDLRVCKGKYCLRSCKPKIKSEPSE